MRLHIGGEQPKKGWKILNIQEAPDVDFVGDCGDLSQFEDNSVSEIYASHILEHLGYMEELPNALKEWYRVLKPNGKIMISVPDLDALCRYFLKPGLKHKDRFHIMRIMFGGQVDPFDFHKIGFTEEFLREFLVNAGFRNPKRVKGFNFFQDCSSLMLGKDMPVSLNMKAAK